MTFLFLQSLCACWIATAKAHVNTVFGHLKSSRSYTTVPTLHWHVTTHQFASRFCWVNNSDLLSRTFLDLGVHFHDQKLYSGCFFVMPSSSPMIALSYRRMLSSEVPTNLFQRKEVLWWLFQLTVLEYLWSLSKPSISLIWVKQGKPISYDSCLDMEW